MTSSESQSRILLVDDEVNVVSALRRLLRSENYQIDVASDGIQALELMEGQEYDLIISDARMPVMDGPTFLARVQERWPSCMRILLTGYADLTMTVKAINEGHIYRYISKPWNDDELRIMVRQALQYRHLERERLRLLELTREQNDQLKELNATLEQRVLDRTAELKQTADWLDLAYADLKKSYVTATQVFSSLMNFRISKDRQTNSQVVAVVSAYCRHHKLSERVSNDLAMAAALYNVGKLTWDEHLLNQPADLLRDRDKVKYAKYPELGASLLMTLEPLQEAARIIKHHQERWDGAGIPDGLSKEEIPFGSRLLRLAVDFVEFQKGGILSRKLGRDEALSVLEKYADRLYDPELSKTFVALCREITPDALAEDPRMSSLDTRRLEPGMVIARNLLSDRGLLLLNEGKELTRELIERVRTFESSEGSSYSVVVYRQAHSGTAN
ncbi:two-component system response regulator [Acidovorax sp. Root70]|nr:two-component system response regulator [Acidovorax sp. Root70]